MDTVIEPPKLIADRIELKRLAREAEQRLEAEQREIARREHEAQGKAMVDEYIASVLQDIPEWIRVYLDMTDHEIDYVRFANKWDRLTSIDLYFLIPGLSEIAYDTEKKQWRAAEAHWRGYVEEDPWLGFSNAYWRTDLDYVLLVARSAMDDHRTNLEKQKALVAAAKEQAERDYARFEMDQEKQAEAHHQAELQAQKEQAEEQALFDVLKNDPVALWMLKAFVMLRSERITFEQRLYEAEESVYSMDEYWSRKAADLRKHADEAQRRADDEKARLQSDLDDAEAKLKKVQRGY